MAIDRAARSKGSGASHKTQSSAFDAASHVMFKILNQANVSYADLVKASEQTGLIDKCASTLRSEVVAYCAPMASASTMSAPTPSDSTPSASKPSVSTPSAPRRSASKKVVKLAGAAITSSDRTLTSPKAYSRCDPTTAGKRALSFVAKVSIDDRTDLKSLTLWFSSTQSTRLFIKKGSALWDPNDYDSCVEDGRLCRISGVVRGKHKGEDCLMFEKHSQWHTLDSSTSFSAIERLNAELDGQIYGPSPTKPPAASKNPTGSISLDEGKEYIDLSDAASTISDDSVTRFRKIWAN